MTKLKAMAKYAVHVISASVYLVTTLFCVMFLLYPAFAITAVVLGVSPGVGTVSLFKTMLATNDIAPADLKVLFKGYVKYVKEH